MPPSTANSALDPWTPEPELRESPPRRSAALEEDFPDLNRPSMVLYMGAGGVLLVAGLVLLFVGFAGHKLPLGFLGILLSVGGAILVGLYPAKQRSHDDRIERLINFGVPVRARILAAENMTGDSAYGRSVKYQIVMPGGDLVHRSVNADERRLPKVVPGDTTALMDMQSGDAELYCAMPRRAVMREAVATPTTSTPTRTYTPTAPVTPVAPVAPTYPTPSYQPASVPPVPTTPVVAVVEEAPVVPGRMQSLGGPAPVRVAETVETPAVVVEPVKPVVPEPVEEEKPKEPAGTSGLPWE